MKKVGWIGLGVFLAGPLLLCGGVQGQDVVILAKGGVNTATIAWSPSTLGTRLEELERRVGFSAGLAGAIAGPGRMRFHLEALVTEKGFVERDGSEEARLRVRYLEIPVLTGVALTDGDGPWVPELYAGPWVAFETSCQAGLRSPALEVDFDCDEVPDDPVLRETWDWGLALGGLLELALTPALRGRADVRYTLGLHNVDGAPDLDNIDVRHRGVSVTLGFGWALGS